MKNRQVGMLNKFIVGVTFLIMVTVNALANILPINGVNTGQVSDSYPNLFAPAGITFAIWGVIYLLLGGYTLFHMGLFHGREQRVNEVLLQKSGTLFAVSSLANGAWIFAWHYGWIPLSMLLMVLILGCLIRINLLILEENLTFRERLFIRLPFSVYFGWITVATIANATVLLVSIGWKGFGISEPVWTLVALFLGMLIGVWTLLRNRDMAYGLVLIWAYGGICLKHSSPEGFAGQYPAVINGVLGSLAVFAVAEAYLVVSRRKRIHRRYDNE